MAKNEDGVKVPFTYRLPKRNLERLQNLAQGRNSTVSALTNKAVTDFLDNQSDGDSVIDTETQLGIDDIKKITPVIEAMGTSVPLSLFLEMIELQRMKSSSE